MYFVGKFITVATLVHLKSVDQLAILKQRWQKIYKFEKVYWLRPTCTVFADKGNH